MLMAAWNSRVQQLAEKHGGWMKFARLSAKGHVQIDWNSAPEQFRQEYRQTFPVPMPVLVAIWAVSLLVILMNLPG
jgi:ribose/xylose/arabinose/galactoside ABC-type transport system permease subunit